MINRPKGLTLYTICYMWIYYSFLGINGLKKNIYIYIIIQADLKLNI